MRNVAHDTAECARVEAALRESERRLQAAEDELHLLQTVMSAISEAEDLEDAFAVVLQKVCAITGWDLGQAWTIRADGSRLECSPAWYARGPGLEAFRRASEQLSPRPGEGFAGRVWSTGQPVWLPDVTADSGFLRLPAASAMGLKAGLAVPVLAGERVVASMEFFLFQAREQDERLVRLVSSVAAQLGSVIQRKQVEAERAQLLRQSEAAEGKFRTLVESAPDAMVIVDGSGCITLINRQAEEMFGYQREELLGQPVETLVPETSRGVHAQHRARYAAGPTTRPMGIGLELHGRRKDGRTIPVEISLSPVESAGEVLVVSVIRDVTEKRELEEAKDEFFGNVSHELRTPLAAIKASIGVVLANEPPGTPEPLHRMFVNIDLASDRMAKLVGDLLELTRLQAGRAELRADHCDLRAVALRSAHVIEPLAQAHGQRLELDLPPQPVPALADAERLEHALLNLLGNAQKYGRPSGKIGLHLGQHGDRVTFAVSDDGPGIPAADQQRIFERFYRPATEATRQHQGSGLGLAIARAMVELHGGRLRVQSSPGVGSTFTIELPTRPPEAGNEEDQSA